MNITSKKNTGFTIVELLVVIVVIGILAAITMVSYSGVKNKADTAKNQSNASSIQKAVASYYASNGSYPAWTTDSAGTIGAINATTNVAKAPTNITLVNGVATAGTNIGYRVTDDPGVCISFWDYTPTAGVRYIGVGDVTLTGNTNGYATACS